MKKNNSLITTKIDTNIMTKSKKESNNNNFDEFDKIDSVSLFLGLSTYEIFQGYNYGIFNFIVNTLNYSKGSQILNKLQLVSLLNKLNSPIVAVNQDPPEDVFLTSLSSKIGGTYKIFQANYNDNSFYLERFIDIIDNLPNSIHTKKIKTTIHSLLKISTIIADRLEIKENNISYEYFDDFINCKILDDINNIKERTKITQKELIHLDIDIKNLEPFIFNFENLNQNNVFDFSTIEKFPIYCDEEDNYFINVNMISIAIRSYILSNLLNESQNKELFFKKLIISYENLLKRYNMLGDLPRTSSNFITVKKIDNYFVQFLSITVSLGYPLLFVFLFDDFSGNLKNCNNEAKHIEIKNNCNLNICINQNIKSIISKNNYIKGLTVIVNCGWGRPTMYSEKDKHSNIKNWDNIFFNAHDFFLLSDYPFFKSIDLFRIKKLENKLFKNGGQLINLSGLINLYGFILENDGDIVPHEKIIFDAANEQCQIILSTDSLISVKQISRLDKSRRMILNLDGKYYPAISCLGTTSVSNKYIQNLFHIIPIHRKDIISVVFINNNKTIWSNITIKSDFELSTLIGTSVSYWLPKIFIVLNNQVKDLPPIIEWNLSVERINKSLKLEEQFNTTENSKISFSTHIYISSNSEFLKEDNSGEKNMVTSFLRQLLLYKKTILVNEIISKIFIDTNMKSCHILFDYEYVNNFKNDLPETILIDKIDEGLERIALGFVTPDKKILKSTYVGVENCSKYLKLITDKLWKEISALLKIYDKELLINKILLNRESVRLEKQTWEKGTRALLSEYKNAALDFINIELSKFMTIEISSRILLEMVTCSQCNNHEEIDLLTFKQLLTKCLLLFQIGNLDEGIQAGLITPEIKVSQFGQIIMDKSFSKNIMEPFISNINNQKRALDSKNYSNYYTHNGEENIQKDKEFEKVWKIEYKLDIEDLNLFIQIINDIGIKNNQIIFKITKNNLINFLCKRLQNNDIDDINYFLDKIILPFRKNWVEIPNNYKTKFNYSDWYPWNFRRKLSIISRPIIDLNKKNLLVSPSSVFESLNYLIINTYEGAFDETHFHSKEMKKWIRTQRTKLGNEFNKTVAKRMQEIGWKAVPDVLVRTIIGGSDNNIFGDVDVLAWSEKYQIVIAIECKNLFFAKTMKEIGHQINDFKGGNKIIRGKNIRDKLKKQFDRLDILSENLEKISKYTGLKNLNYIYGLVVFSNQTIIEKLERVSKDRILFTSLDQLTNMEELMQKLIKWERNKD